MKRSPGSPEPPEPAVAPPRIAVLIATRDRRDLLAGRALASVEAQTRPPDFVVIVEDTPEISRPGTRRLVHRGRLPGTRFLMLRNERRPGAAGAWNTGIDHLARRIADPRRVYLAILDDDDSYEPEHLERCLQRAMSRDVDMVIAPLLRHEAVDDAGFTRKIPRKLKVGDYLVSSQHIQGSNLFLRLSALLAAGTFDEGQTSVTDRDLLIRLAELPNLRFRRRNHPTVHHYAELDRARMSSPRSRTRCEGLTQFHRKWKTRMSVEKERASRSRARGLFVWTEPPPRFDWRPTRDEVSRDEHAAAAPAALVIASRIEPERSDPIRQIESLGQLAASIAAEVPRLELTLLVAVDGGGSDDAGASLATNGFARFGHATPTTGDRARPFEVRLVAVGAAHRAAAARAIGAPDVHPETLATAALAEALRSRPDAVGWRVDADLARDAFFAARGGAVRVVRAVAPFLAALRGGGARDPQGLAGAVTGTPALPALAMLRGQLVDLYHNLHWLGRLGPSRPLPDRGLDNACNRAGRTAWFDAASPVDTDVLERPFWLEPARPAETAREAFARLATGVSGILRGDVLFRPATIDRGAASDSMHPRPGLGGSLMAADAAALSALPRLGFDPPGGIALPAARRATIEATLARGLGVAVSAGVPLRRVRAASPSAPDPERELEALWTDLRGAALAEALDDILAAAARDASQPRDLPEFLDRCGDGRVLARFERLYARRLARRTGASYLALRRVDGVLRSILRSTTRDHSPWAFWWNDDASRAAVSSIRASCAELRRFLESDPATRLRDVASRWARSPRGEAAAFLAGLPASLAAGRAAVESPAVAAALDVARPRPPAAEATRHATHG